MSGRAPSKELVEYALQRATPATLLDETLRLIERSGQEFSAEAGEVIASQLVSRLADRAELERGLRVIGEQGRPLARFVAARVLTHQGSLAAAIKGFAGTIESLSTPNANVFLHRARLLAQEKSFREAAADLTSALRLAPPYSFFVKCERLLDRIVASGDWTPRRKAKLAILGTSTTALLASVLRASAFRSGLQLEVYEGVYGNYQQEILDPSSALYQFRPDLVVLLVNHRDLLLSPVGDEPRAVEFAANLRALWDVLRRRHPCHIVQVGLDLPSGGAWGSLEDTLSGGRRRAVAKANLALAEDLPSGVSFLDPNTVGAQWGTPLCSDAEWCSMKQYPATAALPLFADHLCAQFLAALGLTSKVLVLDLDNTLWGGVIGEDSLGSIRIGPPTAEGEGYLELQKYVKELQQRGVVLAVCSKNNLADAELPFRQHDAMHLRLDDFAAFVANWQDKATNLEAIASDLSLGLDAFVFLDDNPLERALVRARLPQVVVPECGKTPWGMLAVLRRGLYFESLSLTQEDRERNASYRTRSERKSLEMSSASLDDFLLRLEMTAEHGPIDEQTLPRVTQLINKTNQFNLTTRRYTEAQVRSIAQSADWWGRWFRLADRFGDHGLVGVILARIEDRRWTIDTWLMSCRVLGRKLEDFILCVLLSAAQERNAVEVLGEYIPTEKNRLVRDLYPSLGFRPAADGSAHYTLNLAGLPPRSCEFIRWTLRDAREERRAAA